MQTFRKEERLSGKKKIDFLFAKGAGFKEGSFVIIWIEKATSLEFPAQVLISIPKKNIVKASQRNVLKRFVKEAYRKQKNKLYDFLEKHKKQIQFAIIYQKSTPLKYNEIESEINLILNRLTNKF